MKQNAENTLAAWAEFAAGEQVKNVLNESLASGADPILQMDAMILTSKKIIEMAEQAKAEIERDQYGNGRLQ
jgi:hypothetical protein